MLAGCGGGSGTRLTPSSAGLTTQRTHVRPAYTVIYSFKGRTGDGAEPHAGLINVNGTLYGTTDYGGANCSRRGCGTVFSIATSGTENVLHSFGGAGERDGKYPQAGLLNVKGTLYGTTYYAGAYHPAGDGTVFAISASGKETVLHSFAGDRSDGALPEAGLIDVNGTLYGTTKGAGAHGVGTVYAITTSGKETVLYSFGGSRDGADPEARLVNLKGTLYGTTYNGGRAHCRVTRDGCGTVFAITTSGKETVLHRFGGSGDGYFPLAGLIDVKGTLYGTTSIGGGNGLDCRFGCGTVFSITPSGKETVLHEFGGSSGEGTNPAAGLINIKGTLYGTTFGGGTSNAGTVFAITTSGKETVLYSFKGEPDGEYPQAGLLNVNGTLYGTTYNGGANGYGTVFSLSP
jgi:uncharacterized repeat protein (TIGR03803 family)